MTVVALDDDRPVGHRDVAKSEVRTDLFRASGKGGQNRNKVETAVRLTHIPTGIVVTATEERYQGQNLKVAWRRLREAVERQNASNVSEQINSRRSSQFDQRRTFTWTAWRDQVRTSDGRRASMKRALRGKLADLLPEASSAGRSALSA